MRHINGPYATDFVVKRCRDRDLFQRCCKTIFLDTQVGCAYTPPENSDFLSNQSESFLQYKEGTMSLIRSPAH